jgi:Sulfotransferase family
MSARGNKRVRRIRKGIEIRTTGAHPTRLAARATLPFQGRDKQSAPRRKPAAPPRDPRRFAPLFVLAPTRSYTSVIATMIGQHPDLAGLPELKLFSYRTIGELEASLPSYWIERGFTHRSPGLVRALAQFEFGDQTAESLASARAWLRLRAHWSGADVLDVLLARLAPRTAVEKSPENLTTTAALRRLASAYPEARYLHLTRDPATTQASMAEHLLRTVPEHPRVGEPMAGIAAWRNVHAGILRFAATLPGDRVMRVRAEDVLNDPRAQLRAIAAWLRLRTDDAAIEAMCHPEASPFARFGPPGSGVIGGHDHCFLRDPIPRRVEVPPTIEQPPGWHGEPRLWQRTVELARQLGYGDARAQTPRRSRQKGAAIDPGALREELVRRRDIDRAARSAYAGAPGDMARLMEMDSDNTAWLMAIVEQVGWPGHSLVGDDGAQAAWLLAQHSDLNPAFQRRCLELLRHAVERGEASPADLAHLTDRVLLACGEPQLYGTQVTVREGQYVPAQLRDPETVDARRAAVGLDPIAAHLGRALERHGPPKATRRACPDCGEPIEVWLPEPGGTTRFKCPVCCATGTVHTRPRAAPPPA